MRISDLSRQSGVPVATIKFYLRERLLPPGQSTGRNQAVYGEKHLRRLLLIRAFTNIGQLDLTSVRELLTAIESDGLPLPAVFEIVGRVLSFPQDSAPGPADDETNARNDVDAFIDELGWHVEPDAVTRDQLIAVITALRRLGCDCTMDFFTPQAEAASRLAEQELDLLSPEALDRGAAVARGVLLEVALTTLRRMAQQHHVALRYGHVGAGQPS
jgi:DNA-binding transcriptional MerR regulator